MLPRNARIGKKLFSTLLEGGRTVHSQNLNLKFGLFSKERPRISFVASKKNSKKASDRNYLRRLGYQAIRPIYKDLPDNFAGIFFFKPTFKKSTIKHLTEELKNLLSRLK